jgi:probable biosynthetic protein (TIGR04098 family)
LIILRVTRMSSLSVFWRKQRDRWDRIGIDRRHQLRRWLIRYVTRHGFEIGDYSIGAPDIRFFRDESRLKIGKYCSIAAGSTFVVGGDHRTETITTYPLGRAYGNHHPNDALKSRGDIVLGCDVWVATNALILSGVTIGDGAVIGAGSVVISDVPPYAVVFGNPARVMSKRFSDEDIAELIALRWWDLSHEQVKSLHPLLESTEIDAFIDTCRKYRGLPPRQRNAPSLRQEALTVASVESRPAPAGDAFSGLAAQVVAIIQGELPEFSEADLHTPFALLGLDSFGLLLVRTRVEEAFDKTIDDETWGSVVTPASIVHAVAAAAAPSRATGPGANASERRSYNLNMPQMALGGLSESWLVKEFGDIHWSMITKGLGSLSHMLQDANGDRLYATFTRVQFESTTALIAYAENERIDVDARISRYGAGMFFSEVVANGDRNSVRARLMSSFSKIGESGSNISLLKGQPEIPPGCTIAALADLPVFGRDYRVRRSEKLAPPIFECEYEIIPSHDINGVGLLYFAAYPTINDICATRYAGRSLATGFSTRHRDVFYFSNCDPDETLIYRLHRWAAASDRVEMEGSISRKSDGVLMAYIMTVKDACGAPKEIIDLARQAISS